MTDTLRDQASKEIQDVQRWLGQLQEQIATQTPQAIAKLARADDIVQGRLPAPPEPPDPPSPPDVDPPAPPDPQPDPPTDEWSFPSPVVNRPENLDFIVAGSELRSSADQTLGTHQNPIKAAIHSSPPGATIRIGIKGETRGLIYGTGSKHGPDTSFQTHPNGEYATPTVHMVGLTGDAKVHGVSLGSQYGRLNALRLFDMTLGDESEEAAMCLGTKAGAWLSELVIDNVMFAPSGTGYGGHGAKWGMHPDDEVGLFIWRNCRRAQRAGVPVTFQEHVGYIKNMGAVWIENNDLSGGNRTGFQYRSDETESQGKRPWGPVVVRDNYADGYGMEHNVHSGGSCITLWCNPDYPTLIEGNRITNARYGCLAVTDYNSSYHDAEGYAHQHVMIRDNVFTQHPGRGNANGGGDTRSPAKAGSAHSLEFERNQLVATNKAYSELTIDGSWLWDHGAPKTKSVRFSTLPKYRVATYDEKANKVRLFTEDELTSMVGA